MLEAGAAHFGAGQDKAAIQKRVCANKQIIGCIYQPSNLVACQPLLGIVSSKGFPSSGSELSRLCSGEEALDVTTASCTGKNEMVNMAISLAPRCFELCSGMCGMLEAGAAHFGAGQDKAAIQKRVCANKQTIGCIYQPSNLVACQPLLDTVSKKGFPSSGTEMSRLCSGGEALDMNHSGVEALDMNLGNRLSAATALLMCAIALNLAASATSG